MKNCFYKIGLFVFACALSYTAFAQRDSLKIDSLKKVLLTEKEDTNKVNTLIELNYDYLDSGNYNLALQYSMKSISISKKIDFKEGLANGYFTAGNVFFYLENYPESQKNYYDALKIYEALNDKISMARTYAYIANSYVTQGNSLQALNNMLSSIEIYKSLSKITVFPKLYNAYNDLANTYEELGRYDSSLRYADTALNYFIKTKNDEEAGFSYAIIGNAYGHKGDINRNKDGQKQLNYRLAEKYYLSALDKLAKNSSSLTLADIYAALGNLYIKLNELNLAKKFIQKSVALSIKLNSKYTLRNSYLSYYVLDSAEKNYQQAFTDYKTYILYRDSLNNEESTKKSVQVQMQYDFDKKESIAKAVQDKKDVDAKRIKNQQYFAIGALGIVVLSVIIIALIQFRNNKQKQKANNLITKQKQQVETTLTELKSTQAQLIQSEKMASLGELTAGIAHEIQNPLNFVNNFSEVNKELVDELQTELKSGNTAEALAISNDIKDNSEKINHHGKRADAIVRGMLQHSKKTSGQKEPTDINTLSDEYLRLSFHGMRAKDKDFNATLTTEFDESVGNINIIPQEISRVLLNLYNNAFYAVNEKAKQQTNGYDPTISVATKKAENRISITVSDNGNGIPQKVIDKIFQPFFTTKPTGEGTGLGLSLVYDIIIKEHNGTIKVESKEGEGSTFIINLPIK